MTQELSKQALRRSGEGIAWQGNFASSARFPRVQAPKGCIGQTVKKHAAEVAGNAGGIGIEAM
ncbi:MAG: hypothetical protein EHM67_10245 [Hyphomicrobiaceae bacterium]|nr:MAG: hypothetical protein EHM67_10245 [Hyphomicrobiaceae bacterium]